MPQTLHTQYTYYTTPTRSVVVVNPVVALDLGGDDDVRPGHLALLKIVT